MYVTIYNFAKSSNWYYFQRYIRKSCVTRQLFVCPNDVWLPGHKSLGEMPRGHQSLMNAVIEANHLTKSLTPLTHSGPKIPAIFAFCTKQLVPNVKLTSDFFFQRPFPHNWEPDQLPYKQDHSPSNVTENGGNSLCLGNRLNIERQRYHCSLYGRPCELRLV